MPGTASFIDQIGGLVLLHKHSANVQCRNRTKVFLVNAFFNITTRGRLKMGLFSLFKKNKQTFFHAFRSSLIGETNNINWTHAVGNPF